jgi:predicted dehydrogenase
MSGRIRMGMVGGGSGAFIGPVHRLAAEMTGQIELVAGAFSSDPGASKAFGADLGLAADRCYGTYTEMFEAEHRLPAPERIQCVSIVTPNNTHAPIACAALDSGIHVICDKPLAGHLEEALQIEDSVHRSGLIFALTHTYTGYPLVVEARQRVRAGEIGDVRRVSAVYFQDWLSHSRDTTGSKQAAWRCDPAQSGESGAFADIGTHAFNLVEFVTGQHVIEVAAELRKVIQDRPVDDDGAAMFHLSGGASGTLAASQVCNGAVNGLRIEVYGTEASIHWAQERPNTLTIRSRGEPDQILQPGANVGYLSPQAVAMCRTPAGHPEGYIEAFANQYASFAEAIAAFPESIEPVYASVADGVAAMRFIRAAIESSNNGSAWTKLDRIEHRQQENRQ